jgi:hypothetical protein
MPGEDFHLPVGVRLQAHRGSLAMLARFFTTDGRLTSAKAPRM